MICFVAIDTLLREQTSAELFWKTLGARTDNNLKHLSRTSKPYTEELTFEKATEALVEKCHGIQLNLFIVAQKALDLVLLMKLLDC